MPLVYLRKIVKKYKHTIALNELDLDIYEEEFVIIMGASGSGKSTLLNIIASLDTPNSGEYNYMGVDMTKAKNPLKALFRQKIVGVIFQRHNLLNKLSIKDNLMLAEWGHLDAAARKNFAKFEDLLLTLEIPGKDKNAQIDHLSFGEQQRVAIARSMINDPKIILADEPTGNLDRENGIKVVELLKKLNTEKKKTIVLVTHNPDYKKYADRIIYISDGKIDHIDVINNKKKFIDYTGDEFSSQKPCALGLAKIIYLLKSIFVKEKAKLIFSLFLMGLGVASLVIFIGYFIFLTAANSFPGRYQAQNQIIVSGLDQNYTYLQDAPYPYDNVSAGRVIDDKSVTSIGEIADVQNDFPVIFTKIDSQDPTVSLSFDAVTGPPVGAYNPTVDPVLYGSYFSSDTENSITIDQDAASVIASQRHLRSMQDVVGQTIPIKVTLRQHDLGNNIEIDRAVKVVGILLAISGDYGLPQLPYNFGGYITSGNISQYEGIIVNVDKTNNVSIVNQAIKSMGYDTGTYNDYVNYENQLVASSLVVNYICLAFAILSILFGFVNILGLTIYQRIIEILTLVTVGTKNSDIKRYLFLQSFILSLIIGTIGVVLGYVIEIGVTSGIDSLPILQNLGVVSYRFFQFDINSIVIPIGFAVLICIIETMYISSGISAQSKIVNMLRRE